MFKKKKEDQQGKDAKKENKTKKLSDEELGKRICTLYTDVMAEIAKMVGTKPDIPLIKQPILDLKERAIKELVILGKMKVGRNTQQRAMIDLTIMNMFSRMEKAVDFKYFQEAITFYRTKDRDFSDLLMSFNIITQYADFELLKKQAPKEAERLGIP
jgi:hypothetical protein